MDINAIRGRLNKLQNTQKKSDLFWKPQPGNQQVRIVPYKFDEANPFIELLFHYNLNNKTYLSPASFGRPDPIFEFAEKLKSMGNKEDWKTGKNMEPKLRTYVPVLVRGQENEGVKFWGFGKTVYQDLLGYIADPDYGDISDLATGRDITIEYVTAAEGGTQFPTTNIRVKPNQSPLTQSADDSQKLVDNQTKITDLYTELPYEDLKKELEKWLSPDEESAETSNEGTQYNTPAPTQPAVQAQTPVQPAQTQTPAPTVAQPNSATDVGAAFDDLFNN